MQQSTLDQAKLQKLRLDPSRVGLHQRRIKGALKQSAATTFKIIDTCRLDNGGILPARWLHEETARLELAGFVAFIPAAGAASRYFTPLTALQNSLMSHDLRKVKDELRQLGAIHAEQWALPATLKQLLNNPESIEKFSDEEQDRLLRDLSQPKALQPCTLDGESFLRLKNLEHLAIKGLDGQVFVTPPGKKDDFQENLGNTSVRAVFLEQGPELSTIRFNADAAPVTAEDGEYSVVPAGHGTLTRLLPVVRQSFNRSHSIFIRNIDNAMGNSPDAIAATENFLRVHQKVLGVFQGIRRQLASANIREAAAIAEELLPAIQKLPLTEAAAAFLAKRGESIRSLWLLQLRLVQTSVEHCQNLLSRLNDKEALQALYQRPVNILGQVPNTQKDVGGTPVFVTTDHGPQKVCLELPHASKDDVRDFLANSEKATHFNPVFVCAEILDDPHAYESEANPFWIMAAKKFQGQPVYYHETVLYELLGNNFLANALFMEVPRLVFHPHKTLEDTTGKQLRNWVKN